MTILPRTINRYSTIPSKIVMAFSPRTRANNFKICMETQKTVDNQNNLEIEDQSWKNHGP